MTSPNKENSYFERRIVQHVNEGQFIVRQASPPRVAGESGAESCSFTPVQTSPWTSSPREPPVSSDEPVSTPASSFHTRPEVAFSRTAQWDSAATPSRAFAAPSLETSQKGDAGEGDGSLCKFEEEEAGSSGGASAAKGAAAAGPLEIGDVLHQREEESLPARLQPADAEQTQWASESVGETASALDFDSTSLMSSPLEANGSSGLQPPARPLTSSSPEHSSSTAKPSAAAGHQQWAKYGEAHSDEAATPASFLWAAPDGCWCGYATEFLFYNKTAERLLPFEALDTEEPGGVAMFAKLLHVSLAHSAEELEMAAHPSLAEAYPHRAAFRRKHPHPNALRGRRCARGGAAAASATPLRVAGEATVRSPGSAAEAAALGGETCLGGAEAEAAAAAGGGGEAVLLPRIPKHLRSFPVRVELREWRIAYGASPLQVPSLWVVSALGRHYRLEKPAGRYASLFAAAKRKFEVAARVIPHLLAAPNTCYDEMREWLTAAELRKLAPAAAEGALLCEGTEGQSPPPQATTVEDPQDAHARRAAAGSEGLCPFTRGGDSRCASVSSSASLNASSPASQAAAFPRDPALLFAHSKLISGLSTRKGKSAQQYALSDPEGTGVRVLPDGSASSLCGWGGAFAVQGLTESGLLQLAPFLLREAAAVEATLNGGPTAESPDAAGAASGEAGGSAAAPVALLSLPFFTQLRARAAAFGVSTPPLEFFRGSAASPWVSVEGAEGHAPPPGEPPQRRAEEKFSAEDKGAGAAEAVAALRSGGGRGGGRRGGRRLKPEMLGERAALPAAQPTAFAESASASLGDCREAPASREASTAAATLASCAAAAEEVVRRAASCGAEEALHQRRDEEEGQEEMRFVSSGKPLDELSLNCHSPLLQSHPLPLSRLVLYRHPELLQVQDFLRVFAEYSQIPPPSLQSLEAAVLVSNAPPGGEARKALGPKGPETRGFFPQLREALPPAAEEPQQQQAEESKPQGEAPAVANATSSEQSDRNAGPSTDAPRAVAASAARFAVTAAEAIEKAEPAERLAKALPLFLGDALLLRYVQLALPQVGDAIPRAAAASASSSAEEVLLPHEKNVPASLWLGLDSGLCDAVLAEGGLLMGAAEDEGGGGLGAAEEGPSSADGICACFERDAFGEASLTSRLRRLMAREEQLSLLNKVKARLPTPGASKEAESSPLQSLADLPLDVRLLDPLTAPVLLKRVLFECLYTPRRRRFKTCAVGGGSAGAPPRSCPLEFKTESLSSDSTPTDAFTQTRSSSLPPETPVSESPPNPLGEGALPLLAPPPPEAASAESDGAAQRSDKLLEDQTSVGGAEARSDISPSNRGPSAASERSVKFPDAALSDLPSAPVEGGEGAATAKNSQQPSNASVSDALEEAEYSTRTETDGGTRGEETGDWKASEDLATQVSAVELQVDEAKAELCGVSSWELDGFLVALHALRGRSFWILPRRIRCLLLHQLQLLVATGWQARFFLDCKVEALGRARLGLLRLKAAASQHVDDSTGGGASSNQGPTAAGGVKTPPKNQEAGFKGDPSGAGPSGGAFEAEGLQLKKEEEGGGRSSDASGVPAKAQRRRPVGRVTNAEAERLTLCFSVRAELLGQDRFLNRYFSVGAADGRCTAVYVEAVCQPSPAQLLAHRARAEALAALQRSPPEGGRAGADSAAADCSRDSAPKKRLQRPDGDDAATEAKRARMAAGEDADSAELAAQTAGGGGEAGVVAEGRVLGVYPPCKAETDAFATLSSWPIVRRPFDIRSLHAFLEMLQVQRSGSCCFKVEPDTLPLLAGALHPGLQRERLLKTQLLAAHAKIEAGPRPSPSLLPPSPLASGVWTACKSLLTTDALLLRKCLPTLWELPQKRELSEAAVDAKAEVEGEDVFSAGAAFRAAMRLLCAAAACSACEAQHAEDSAHADTRRGWKAQALFTAALTQLLLQVEALVEEAGCVHAAAWALRREAWKTDLVRLAGGSSFLALLPLRLPQPGQPEEAPEDLRDASEESAVEEDSDGDAPLTMRRRRGRLRRRHQTLSEGDSTSDAEEVKTPEDEDSAAAGDVPRRRASARDESAKQSASFNSTPPTSSGRETSGTEAQKNEAHEPPKPHEPHEPHQAQRDLLRKLRPSFSPAMADRAVGAAEAAAQRAATLPPSEAEAVRFEALLQSLCMGFGWNRAAVEALLEAEFEKVHFSDSPAPADKMEVTEQAAVGEAAERPVSEGLVQDAASPPDLWTALRRDGLESLGVWGLLFALWRLSGIDSQRLLDLHTTLSREDFEEMLEGHVQRRRVPRVGDELIYFRKGHEQLIQLALQADSTRGGGGGCCKTGCALLLPASLGWAEALRVESVHLHAGVTSASAAVTGPEPLLPPHAAEAGGGPGGGPPVQNALQAMPCGGLEACAAGLLPSLFSFVLEDDPVALGLAKPSQPPLASPGAVGPSSAEMQSSSTCTMSPQHQAAAADASPSETDGEGLAAQTCDPADGQAPQDRAACEKAKPGASSPTTTDFEGVVPAAVEDFLLQADPLRLAARSAESAKAYLQRQLDAQRTFLREQRTGSAEASSTSAVFDATFSPYFRVVCSVKPRRHPTSCDSVASHVRRMAASAAAGRLSTRTSSRLSRSNCSGSSANDGGGGAGAEASRRVSTTEDAGQASPPAPDDEAVSASGGEGSAEGTSLSALSLGPQTRRRWVVLCVPLRHLSNCSSPFLVSYGTVSRAFKASWCCGMRFRMSLESCPSAATAAAGTVPRAARGLGLAVCNEALREQRALQQEQRLTGVIKGIALQPSTLWEGVSVEWDERRSTRPDSSVSACVAAAATCGKLSLWQLEPLKRLKRPGSHDL